MKRCVTRRRIVAALSAVLASSTATAARCPPLLAYCPVGRGGAFGLSHTLSNLLAIIKVAASQGHDPVLLPMPLHAGHNVRPECANATTTGGGMALARSRVVGRASPGRLPPSCVRAASLTYGDGILHWGGFMFSGTNIRTFEARRAACPLTCPAESPLGPSPDSGGQLRECTVPLTLRVHTERGVGRWGRCAVRVLMPARDDVLVRVAAAALIDSDAVAACSMHPRISHAARRAAAEVGGHPFTAVHIRAGDVLAASPAMEAWLTPARVAAALGAPSGGTGGVYVATDLPQWRVDAIATAVKAATGRRVFNARTVSAFTTLRRESNFALFAAESALVALADTRVTTFGVPGGRYAPTPLAARVAGAASAPPSSVAAGVSRDGRRGEPSRRPVGGVTSWGRAWAPVTIRAATRRAPAASATGAAGSPAVVGSAGRAPAANPSRPSQLATRSPAGGAAPRPPRSIPSRRSTGGVRVRRLPAGSPRRNGGAATQAGTGSATAPADAARIGSADAGAGGDDGGDSDAVGFWHASLLPRNWTRRDMMGRLCEHGVELNTEQL